MKTYLMAAAAIGLGVAGATSTGITPARAGTVCLTDNDSPNTYRSCEYYSFRACRASSRGVGGSCVRNPWPDSWGGEYGYVEGPTVEFGSAYNRYDGPIYHRGYGGPGYRW